MKLRLVLSAGLVIVLLLDFGLCQKGKDNDLKKRENRKHRERSKAAGKKAKALPAKVKASPSPPTRPIKVETFITQVLGKGKFQKVGGTLSVPSGSSVELRCKGEPIQWAVPPYLEEEDEGRLRVVQHKRYSTLLLANTTGADTGEYACIPMYCEDQDCRRQHDKAVKVFIFFPDPQELFVPTASYYEVIELRTNRPATLPCRVSSPVAKVTLHREFPPEQVRVDGAEISFDERKGFTIHQPKPHHAGSVYCMASLGVLRQSSITYMLIYVNYPIAPPSPVIKASSTSVRIGDNLQVLCSVLGEVDVAIDFTWEFPGQKIGRPLYTEDSVHAVHSGQLGQQQSQSVLLVEEVRDVDQGTYTCTAQNLEGSRFISTTVKVLPARGVTRSRTP